MDSLNPGLSERDGLTSEHSRARHRIRGMAQVRFRPLVWLALAQPFPTDTASAPWCLPQVSHRLEWVPVQIRSMDYPRQSVTNDLGVKP